MGHKRIIRLAGAIALSAALMPAGTAMPVSATESVTIEGPSMGTEYAETEPGTEAVEENTQDPAEETEEASDGFPVCI